MSKTFIPRIQELAKFTRMLALVGASIKLRSSALADSEIKERIDTGALMALTEAGLVNEDEIPLALTMIEMAVNEAAELLRNPERGSNWEISDAAALQLMGRASKSAFSSIRAISDAHPQMREALNGTFLDVGTGVAGLALEAAAACPEIKVEGIDIWEPALELARRNIAESSHSSRVSVRNVNIASLDDVKRYSLAWLPTMYMKRPIVEAAIDRIERALVPGGYLVAGLYTRAEDPFLALVADLSTLRGGGEIGDAHEITRMMEAGGFVLVETRETPIATYVVGRLP